MRGKCVCLLLKAAGLMAIVMYLDTERAADRLQNHEFERVVRELRRPATAYASIFLLRSDNTKASNMFTYIGQSIRYACMCKQICICIYIQHKTIFGSIALPSITITPPPTPPPPKPLFPV